MTVSEDIKVKQHTTISDWKSNLIVDLETRDPDQHTQNELSPHTCIYKSYFLSSSTVRFTKPGLSIWQEVK